MQACPPNDQCVVQSFRSRVVDVADKPAECSQAAEDAEGNRRCRAMAATLRMFAMRIAVDVVVE